MSEYNYEGVSMQYLRDEFYVNEATVQALRVDYQDWMLIENEKLITSMKETQDLHLETIKDLKEINALKDEKITILEDEIDSLNGIVESSQKLLDAKDEEIALLRKMLRDKSK